MFDQTRLKMNYRPKPPGAITRKRPLALQPAKRIEPPIKIPRLLNKPIPLKPHTTNTTRSLTIKPTPTFTSRPTFTSYNQPKKQRLSRPTVRPTRTLNKIPTKHMLSPRNTPETDESGFVSQEPTLKPKIKSVSTRQKRKLPRDDDEYKPKLKKRRIRKHLTFTNIDPSKREEPNYDWRDKDKIAVPDIFEITPDQWPEDKDDFDETYADISNKAYYVRHFRAEQRERIFYQKLQKWRDKEQREQALDRGQKLRVADRPRGPWQVKLPKNLHRGPQHIPSDILEEPKFNYVRRGSWTQPVRMIRRIVKVEPKYGTRLSCKSGGKEIGRSYGGPTFSRNTGWDF